MRLVTKRAGGLWTSLSILLFRGVPFGLQQIAWELGSEANNGGSVPDFARLRVLCGVSPSGSLLSLQHLDPALKSKHGRCNERMQTDEDGVCCEG